MTQVSTIAANLIPMFLPDGTPASAAPFHVGEVEWGYLDDRGEHPFFYARNTSTKEVGLTFSFARQADDPGGRANISVFQPLEGGRSYRATQDLVDFHEGEVMIAPVTELPGNLDLTGLDLTDSRRSPGRAISFAIRSIAVGTTVFIVGGTHATVIRTKGGYSVSIISDDQNLPREVAVHARGLDGSTVSASMRRGTGLCDLETNWNIPLPPGIDLDPIVGQLELRIELADGYYRDATHQRRELQLTL
jgi:hypothetical protein